MQTLLRPARGHRSLLALALPLCAIAALRRPHGPADDEDDDGPDKASLQSLITRAGTAEAAANELWRDNFKLRQDRKNLRTENADLKAKLPPDGSVVLTKEQAADWELYQKLGKPAEVEKALGEGKTAQEGLLKRDRDAEVRKAADGMKMNPDALVQLFGMHPALEVVSKTVKGSDGKDQTGWYVKDTANNNAETELGQYATTNWQTFLPSLQVQQAGNGGNGQGNQGGQGAGNGNQGQQNNNQGGGQPWLNAGGSGGQGGTGGSDIDVAAMAQGMVQARNQGGNPLAPAQNQNQNNQGNQGK